MAAATDTKTKRNRGDRTTIALDTTTVGRLDALRAYEVERGREAGLVGVEPSRGTMVAALVNLAHFRMTKVIEAAAAANGGSSNEAPPAA
jgi:hypothetical protein